MNDLKKPLFTYAVDHLKLGQLNIQCCFHSNKSQQVPKFPDLNLTDRLERTTQNP